MMSIEAMKQALEALETYHGYMEPLTTVVGGPRVPAEQSTTGKVERTITSLRQAIAVAEQHTEAAVAEQHKKQEPVMGVEVKRIASGGFIGNVWWIHENLQEGVFHLYTHPQPKAEKHEPVACQHKRYSIDVHEQIGTCIDCGSEGRMRFVVDDTHPQPKREPLSDEAIMARWPFGNFYSAALEFARSIEAAHGITSDMKQEHVDKTAKQRHEWVGLTDEDLANCDTEEYKTARYWEAKLKEKNT